MTTVSSLFSDIKFIYISPLQFTDTMMNSFAIQTEDVISSEINKFKQSGPDEEVIEICPEEGIYEYIESYCGLSSHEVSLDEIFTEYFPSLNRRSAFQTIYSTYEVELQALCRRYQSSLGGKKFDKYHDSGLLKVQNFIQHRFPKLKNSPEWKAIDQLRVLRNNCVHNDGRAYKLNGNAILGINRLINNHSNLFHHDGFVVRDEAGKQVCYPNGSARRNGRHVLFEAGSLQYVIKVFGEYVKVVSEEFEKAKPRT